MQTKTAAILNMDFQTPEARQNFQQLTETVQQQSNIANASKQKRLETSEAMITLWTRLGEALGAAFLNQFGVVGGNAFETWSAALADLSPAQIKTGFVGFMRSNDKHLNLKSFRALCLDVSRFGLPEASRAYYEAAMHSHEHKTHKWSHIAVYKTLIDVGVSVMRELPEDQSKPLFTQRYQIICDMVIKGQDLGVELPKAIPSHIPNYCTREQNIARMANLRAELGL